jgi:hypothetical protein
MYVVKFIWTSVWTKLIGKMLTKLRNTTLYF